MTNVEYSDQSLKELKELVEDEAHAEFATEVARLVLALLAGNHDEGAHSVNQLSRIYAAAVLR